MLKSIRNSLVLTSLLYVVLGLLLLLFPGLSLGLARLLVGGVTLIYGVVRIVSMSKAASRTLSSFLLVCCWRFWACSFWLLCSFSWPWCPLCWGCIFWWTALGP